MDAMTEATAVDETGSLPPEFGENVINQMFDLWVLPELRRRGLPEDRTSVVKAAVLLRKDQQPEVRLNEDFVMATKARMTRDIEAGEPITTADIADIEWLVPEEVGPDAAWLAYLTLPDGRAFLHFNFLYERGQARDVITSAAQFLKSADRAAADGHEGPAIENALAAAELSVMALMRVHVATGDGRDKHGARRRWLVGWSEHGNAPDDHVRTLLRLSQLRPFARYGATGPKPKDGEVAKLVEVARDMVATAERMTRPDTPPIE